MYIYICHIISTWSSLINLQPQATHLETHVRQKTDDESSVQTRESRRAELARKRRRIPIPGNGGRRPQLSTILTFPLNVTLPEEGRHRDA